MFVCARRRRRGWVDEMAPGGQKRTQMYGKMGGGLWSFLGHPYYRHPAATVMLETRGENSLPPPPPTSPRSPRCQPPPKNRSQETCKVVFCLRLLCCANASHPKNGHAFLSSFVVRSSTKIRGRPAPPPTPPQTKTQKKKKKKKFKIYT